MASVASRRQSAVPGCASSLLAAVALTALAGWTSIICAAVCQQDPRPFDEPIWSDDVNVTVEWSVELVILDFVLSPFCIITIIEWKHASC